MSILPSDAGIRKEVPIFSGVMRYFPRALAAVAELSVAGNKQHNPGKPLHWDRSKSGDDLDALTRHLLEAGGMDSDGIRHSTKVAWRALANLEKELEAAASPITGAIHMTGTMIDRSESRDEAIMNYLTGKFAETTIPVANGD